MNLLHICSITNNKISGISNVVPDHFINQKKLENVALLNCNKTRIERLKREKNVFYLDKIKNFDKLPKPFNHPDLVIFHGIYFLQYIKIYKKILENNIPYIIIPHGSLTTDAQKIKPLKKYFANLFIFNKFIYKSNYIQYLSDNELNMSKKFNHNSFILGNGINKSNKIKEKFSNNGIKLIYVGRYAIYHKGIDILLDSCEKAYDIMKKNNITLSLYGSGNDGIEKIQKMVDEKKINDIVNVNGPIFGKEKREIILKHDFFIQMSRLEGQPLGIMEAMTFGMPIIVSEGTTFSKIADKEKCGFCCSNSSDFSHVIECIIKENADNFKLMGLNSLKYSKNNFVWDSVASNTIKKYKEIINND